MKKATLVTIALLIALTLAACGGGTANTAYDTASAPAAHVLPEQEMAVGESETPNAGGGPVVTPPQDDRKIIMHAWLTMETLNFTDTCDALQQATLDAGGYISYTSVDNSSYANTRSASLTLRVPTDKYRSFLDTVDAAGTVTNRSESSEDVTSQYVDIEARLKSLRAQEAWLLGKLDEAEDLEALIMLQQQLSETQYQIDLYTQNQRTLDNLTTYSTVEITVLEVKRITEPVEESYGAKIAQAFRNSWRSAGRFFQQLGLFLVSILPLLLFVALVLVVVLIFVRRAKKRRAAQPQPTIPPAPPVYAPPLYQPHSPIVQNPPPAKAPPPEENKP